MCFHFSEQDAAAFAERGALRISAALDPRSLAELVNAVADRQPGRAGIRLQGIPALRSFLAPSGPVGRLAAAALGAATRAVRAVFFDKTAASNWFVPWHQDRTIVVAQRLDVAGFGPWTVKSGLLHVAPPYDVLAGMVTLRLRLDAVPATNAPLLVAPGSQAGPHCGSGRARGGAAMRNGGLLCRGRRRLALCYSDPSCIRSRCRAGASTRAAGRFCKPRASRRIAVAWRLSRPWQAASAHLHLRSRQPRRTRH
jgi:hypothetical protein